ncbi:MAG: TonB-dependent receptor [Bacteroidota bacterium]
MKEKCFFFCAMLFLSMAAFAQTRTVSGKVVGKSADPVDGASVTIKGSDKGAISDRTGNFKLNVPATGNVTLVVTSVGFITKEVKLAANAEFLTIEVEVSEGKQLDDVVVNVGYASVSKKTLAAAVSSITEKDLKDFPVSTVAEALAGKLAGVNVRQTEGQPGAEIQIVVRGGTSLTQDNAPLYIVDGAPLDNALAILSPNEIQTIDVLKDLASTAIYGARGANGVVLITTKSGKKGRTIVSFDAFAGARTITNKLDVLSPYEYVMFQYELMRQHYSGVFFNDTAAQNSFFNRYGPYKDLEVYKSFETWDWQDVIFGRSAKSNTKVLTVNGGNDATTYNFSMNNTNEEGIMLNSGLKRTLATFRFDHKISSKLRLALNMRYSRQKTYGNGTSTTGSGSNSRLKYTVRFQPYIGLVNFEEYDPNSIFDNTINLSNPLTNALQDTRNAYSNTLVTSAAATYNITKGITLKSLVGFNVGENNLESFSGVSNYSVSGRNTASQYSSMPFISLSNDRSIAVTNTNTIEINPTIGKRHRLNVILGQEINQRDGKSFSQSIKYFPTAVTAVQAFANVQQANPPAGAIQPSPVTNVDGERLFSFFGRAMYTFDNKYNVNLLMRRDGSSKFSEANRWGMFPSVQVAWRLSQEKFISNMNLKWLTNLKVRGSFGTAGNNRVPGDRLYQTIFTTSPSDAGYATTDNSQSAGLYSANLANPNLKWETTVSRNIGLDVEMFNSRLSVSLDGYINRTNDLLLQTNVPQQTGYVSQYQNIGSTKNTGVELQISATIFQRKNFNWNSSFNISHNKNVIASLQGGVKSYAVSSGWGAANEDFLVQVGQPVGQFYGYVSDGYYTLDDFDRTRSVIGDPTRWTWVLKPGVANNSIMNAAVFPGAIKFKKLATDIKGDTMIRVATDRTVIGNWQPKFYGGWNNQLSYKNFDMSIFMNFSYGNKVYNANKVEFSSVYQATGNNLLADFKDRWKWFDDNGVVITDWDKLAEANKNTKIYSPTRNPHLMRSDAIEDGSFLRITNVTIGYNLPKKWLLATRYITRVRFYATVNNVYTFTKYTGYDPEANTRRGNPLTPGVDYAAYPRSRYITGGINVTF